MKEHIRTNKAAITRTEVLKETVTGTDVVVRLLYKRGFEVKSTCPIKFKGVVKLILDEDGDTYNCTQEIYE